MSKFSERLKALGFDSYDDYLQSDHWNQFKQSYRASDRPKRCAVCNSGRIQLHHHTYIRLGSELLTDVTPLCRDHHVAVHDWLKSSRRPFVEFTYQAVADLKSIKTPKTVQTNRRKTETKKQKKARLKRERQQKSEQIRQRRERILLENKSYNTPRIDRLMDDLRHMEPTRNQMRVATQFAVAGDWKQIKGMIVNITKLRNKKSNRTTTMDGGK